MQAGKMLRHRKAENRDRQRKADPEPSRHIDELRVWPGFCTCDYRLQRHAAYRAIARAGFPDFRMHRAGVEHTRRQCAIATAAAAAMSVIGVTVS